MTQTSLEFSNNPLLRAAKQASALIDLYTDPATTIADIVRRHEPLNANSQDNTFTVNGGISGCANGHSINNGNAAQYTSALPCSVSPQIHPSEVEKLERDRAECRIHVLESMQVLEDALNRYQYVLIPPPPHLIRLANLRFFLFVDLTNWHYHSTEARTASFSSFSFSPPSIDTGRSHQNTFLPRIPFCHACTSAAQRPSPRSTLS